MLIKTQSGTSNVEVVNMDHVICIETNAFGCDDRTCWIVNAETVNDETVCLGIYKSIMRAKEIVQEIVDEFWKYTYEQGRQDLYTRSYVQPIAFEPPKVYRMPKE